MFVKICGITRPTDATAAVAAGADAIGLNFVPTSHRRVDIETAQNILAVIPDGLMTVGVFKGHATTEIIETAERLGLKAVQLHGEDPPEFTAAVAAEVAVVIKVIVAGQHSHRSIDEHGADIVMLDAPIPGGGIPFDWNTVGDLAETHKILLAGGLRPDNVGDAIRRVRPWGVDVATGVESTLAHKDPDLIARFVAEARLAEELR